MLAGECSVEEVQRGNRAGFYKNSGLALFGRIAYMRKRYLCVCMSITFRETWKLLKSSFVSLSSFQAIYTPSGPLATTKQQQKSLI